MDTNRTETYDNGDNGPTTSNEVLVKNLLFELSSKYELPSEIKEKLLRSLSAKVEPSAVQDLDAKTLKKLLRSFVYAFESCKLRETLSNKFYSLVAAAKYSRNSRNPRIRTYISARYVDKSGDVTEQLFHVVDFDARSKPSSDDLRAGFDSFIRTVELPARNLISVMSDGMCLLRDDADALLVDCLKEAAPHVFGMPVVQIFSSMFDLGDNFRLVDPSVRELVACGEDYFRGNRGRLEQYNEYLRTMAKFFDVKTGSPTVGGSDRSFLTYDKIGFEWTAMKNFFYSEFLKLTLPDDTLKGDGDVLDDVPTTSHPNDFDKTINKTEENVSIVKRLCELLNDRTNQACACFLHHCLGYCERVNDLYQNGKMGLPKVLRLIEELVKALAANFIKEEHIKPLILYQHLDSSKFVKPVDQIYFGPDCAESLKDASPDDLARFHESCTKFYSIVFEKLRRILNEYYREFGPLSYTDPEVALLAADRRNVPDLFKWRLTYFPYVPVYELAAEWRELPKFFDGEQTAELLLLGESGFWKRLGETVNPVTCEQRFPCLKKLVDAVYSLPFSFRDLYRSVRAVEEEEWRENDDGYDELLARSVLLSARQADPTGLCSELARKYKL